MVPIVFGSYDFGFLPILSFNHSFIHQFTNSPDLNVPPT